MSFVIRNAEIKDAERLREIYSYYVENTAVSFEYHTPSLSEFEKRIENISRNYPYLVCEEDGKILGYVYASAYSSREAYSWTAATSIYLDKDCRRKGIGAKLYEELERLLKQQEIATVLAGVAFIENEDEYLTHDSYLFHTKMGYRKAAHLIKVGKKFDRWYDILWMQKMISD